MKGICTACECDPCDCGWGSYVCQYKKRNSDRVYVSTKSWWEYDGSGLEPSINSSWSIYDDCVEYFGGLYGESGSPRAYMGKMVLNFKIGDPVRYFPISNLVNDEGVWIVKDIINKHSLDCSWYDYEITDGSRSVLCRQEELFTLEVK